MPRLLRGWSLGTCVCSCIITESIPLQLESTLDGLFSAQCPDFFEGGARAHVFESYEAYGGKFSSWISKETDAFCGRYSAINPGRIFAIGSDDVGVALSQFSKVCTFS